MTDKIESNIYDYPYQYLVASIVTNDHSVFIGDKNNASEVESLA